MFIALRSLVIPLRQEQHVTEHVKAHCAPLERGVNWKREAIKRAPPEQLAAQTNLNRLLVQS